VTDFTPTPIWQEAFLEPLELEFLDGVNFRITAPFSYETEVLPPTAYGAAIFVVPVGFVTDFGSIPQIFWSLESPIGKAGKGYVLHDLLYRTKGLVTRAQADAILFEAITLLDVSWWSRWTIWSGVRVGGSSSYRGGL
jgi:Protein of unknown function (DUF1353)